MIEAREAAQLLMVGFDGHSPSEDLRDFIRESPTAGVIFFSRNIASTKQMASLVREVRDLWPKDQAPPLLAIDQEGGNVRRLKAPECPDFAPFPSMRAVGLLDDEALSAEVGRVTGAQLAALGLNLNFAPVLDIDTNPANPIINQRAFGQTPDVVSRHALAYARGLESGGVLACGKHFPGHGDSSIDSHTGLPRLGHGLERLREVELAPFKAAVRGGIPSLMSAHIVFEALDPLLPATLSPIVIPKLLREELGYQGVLFSDDLEMAAIAQHFGWDDVARGGLEASIDVFLVCRDLAGARGLRGALVSATQDRPDLAAAARASLARVSALRAKAQDHGSVPYGGQLPLGDVAAALMQRLLG